MGLTFCGIVVDKLPDFDGTKDADPKRLKTKFLKRKLDSLSPSKLSISFKNNCSIILLDMIFYKNISEEEELTDLEKDLNSLFPNSRILIIVINDTADFSGFSLIEDGKKIRTKAVVRGERFLDYGEIFSKEIELYDEYMKSLRSNTSVFEHLENLYSQYNESEKKKAYLMTRDNKYNRLKLENNYNYTNGSLDQFLIEQEFQKILKCDFFDLEQVDFIEFERKKLNFKKDSLYEFLKLTNDNL
ncbi:hypothetical protein [Ekhidna sp.]